MSPWFWVWLITYFLAGLVSLGFYRETDGPMKPAYVPVIVVAFWPIIVLAPAIFGARP